MNLHTVNQKWNHLHSQWLTQIPEWILDSGLVIDSKRFDPLSKSTSPFSFVFFSEEVEY